MSALYRGLCVSSVSGPACQLTVGKGERQSPSVILQGPLSDAVVWPRYRGSTGAKFNSTLMFIAQTVDLLG